MSASSPIHPAQYALEGAADAAMLAPSMMNTQPWQLVLHRDHLEVQADWRRAVAGLDPTGRAVVHGVGAAVLNARVALAAEGWAVQVERLPSDGGPDVLVRLHPVRGAADPGLARLGDLLAVGGPGQLPVGHGPGEGPDVGRLRGFAAVAAEEDAVLVPLVSGEHRQVVLRSAQRAAATLRNDPVVASATWHWTHRPGATGDGVLSTGSGDRRMAGSSRPTAWENDAGNALLVLATPDDDRPAWLAAGQAGQRVLLEAELAGWSVIPVAPALEVELVRADVRRAVTPGMWPQSVLSVGQAAPPPRSARRRRSDVVRGSTRPAGRLTVRVAHRPTGPVAPSRGVSDGRGGTASG